MSPHFVVLAPGLSPPVVCRYLYPPISTIPSNCSVLNPAATAQARVTVNSAEGSMFRSMLRSGELVVDRPAAVNFVLVSIVPSEMPCVLTLERTPVTDNPAVKGFASTTETWATVFSCPVVGSTKRMIRPCLWKRQRVAHQSMRQS